MSSQNSPPRPKAVRAYLAPAVAQQLPEASPDLYKHAQSQKKQQDRQIRCQAKVLACLSLTVSFGRKCLIYGMGHGLDVNVCLEQSFEFLRFAVSHGDEIARMFKRITRQNFVNRSGFVRMSVVYKNFERNASPF